MVFGGGVMNGKKKISLKQLWATWKMRRKMTKHGFRREKITRFLFSLLNKYVFILSAVALMYLFLLILLVNAEKNAPDATIHNLGQAVWYSLATFTTVGYGDLYPVTFAGRSVASIFLVLGIGLLSFFVGFMVDFITHVRPILILSLNADKPWYIFTDRSPHAIIFAENLKAVRPTAMIIYAETKDDNSNTNKYIAVQWSVSELIERRGSLYDLHIMCMKDNEMENFLDSVQFAEHNVPIVCVANFVPAHYPMNINFFSPMDCTARVFWQQYPIMKKKETILLIGFGQAGHMMLDRALELNVLYEDQAICYHIFGDEGDYLHDRKLLSDIVSLNKVADDRDSIVFHADPWNADEELLRNADRIILSSDSEWDNIEVLHKIQKFFSIRGELYIYNSNVRGVATSFGKTRDILTPAFVLHNSLSDMALARHELFRFYSGEDVPMWEDTDSMTKDMNYITTDHISIKVRMLLNDEAPCCPFDEIDPKILRKAALLFRSSEGEKKERLLRLEHERNLRFYKLHNYRYGEKTDYDARTNPMLNSFEKLDERHKQLAETSWLLLDELASHKEAKRR